MLKRMLDRADIKFAVPAVSSIDRIFPFAGSRVGNRGDDDGLLFAASRRLLSITNSRTRSCRAFVHSAFAHPPVAALRLSPLDDMIRRAENFPSVKSTIRAAWLIDTRSTPRLEHGDREVSRIVFVGDQDVAFGQAIAHADRASRFRPFLFQRTSRRPYRPPRRSQARSGNGTHEREAKALVSVVACG